MPAWQPGLSIQTASRLVLILKVTIVTPALACNLVRVVPVNPLRAAGYQIMSLVIVCAACHKHVTIPVARKIRTATR